MSTWGASSYHETNKRAILLYEKFDFKREGIRANDLKYSNDHYVNTVIMGLWVKNEGTE